MTRLYILYHSFTTNQSIRKLGIFDQKLEGSQSLYMNVIAIDIRKNKVHVIILKYCPLHLLNKLAIIILNL